MNVAIFVNTPAQVHFYKNIINKLNNKGHNVKVLARDYGETISLLNENKIEYYIFSYIPHSKYGKILSLPKNVYNAYSLLKDFNPDVITGFGVYDAFTSLLLHARCIVFMDSEPNVNNITYSIQFKLFMPFTNYIITPKELNANFKNKHLRIASYKELSYLHPSYFKPDINIYDLLGISEEERYVLIRFNAFDAVHDFNRKGFTTQQKVTLINELSKYIHVFVSEEGKIPKDIIKYKLDIPYNKIHDVLYYSSLFVCDSQTMATEAAILGTPTIRCNTFVGKNDMSNFIELEKKYGLLYNIENPNKAIELAIKMAKDEKLKELWKKKKNSLLKEKIDIVYYYIDMLENKGI